MTFEKNCHIGDELDGVMNLALQLDVLLSKLDTCTFHAMDA